MLQSGLCAAMAVASSPSSSADALTQTAPRDARSEWIGYLRRVSNPVLHATSEERLHSSMPVEAVPGHEVERRIGSHLEAFARLSLPELRYGLKSNDGSDSSENDLKRTYRWWAQ